jgi:hypothetical protein
MARLGDDELRRLYQEMCQAADGSKSDAEWEAFLNYISKLEKADPWLRNQTFMAERLGDSLASLISKSEHQLPEDVKEKVAKLILLFEKPLIASTILQVMIESCNDPLEALDNAIRMAEVAMNSEFTRLTPEQSEQAIIDSLVENSAGLGGYPAKAEARKLAKVVIERAKALRSAGLKFEELGDYASTAFVERLQRRGLMTRQSTWYRESINFFLPRHRDPYLAAVSIMRMASREPDPTECLAELLVSARGSA